MPSEGFRQQHENSGNGGSGGGDNAANAAGAGGDHIGDNGGGNGNDGILSILSSNNKVYVEASSPKEKEKEKEDDVTQFQTLRGSTDKSPLDSMLHFPLDSRFGSKDHSPRVTRGSKDKELFPIVSRGSKEKVDSPLGSATSSVNNDVYPLPVVVSSARKSGKSARESGKGSGAGGGGGGVRNEEVDMECGGGGSGGDSGGNSRGGSVGGSGSVGGGSVHGSADRKKSYSRKSSGNMSSDDPHDNEDGKLPAVASASQKNNSRRKSSGRIIQPPPLPAIIVVPVNRAMVILTRLWTAIGMRLKRHSLMAKTKIMLTCYQICSGVPYSLNITLPPSSSVFLEVNCVCVYVAVRLLSTYSLNPSTQPILSTHPINMTTHPPIQPTLKFIDFLFLLLSNYPLISFIII